jgi:nitrogen-specific signal transduction histidine kinase/CheY-like chemotaxis protein
LVGLALAVLQFHRANLDIWREIDQRQRDEAQILELRKLTAIGDLAGGIAHHFNNLLTVIIGNLDLARGDSSPAVRTRINEALAASAHASDLVRQLQTFGRQIPPALQPIHLGPLLTQVADMAQLTFDARVSLTVEPAADLAPVLADSSQVHQVLLNLCLNAHDALMDVADDASRPLRIRIDADNVAPNGTHDRSIVRVRVSDTGRGMDKQVRTRIFDPFFTTKEVGKGTGLGLATVHGIVARHQGWVEVESVPGQGSTFSVYLPRATTEAQMTVPAAAVEANSGKEMLLLADDDTAVRTVTEMILAEAGYRVVAVGDGLEAVAAYGRERGRVALALLDVTMPGLSGPQALRCMRESDPNLKVVLLGDPGHADPRAGEAGEPEVLPKPYTAAALLDVVRRVLNG